MTRTIVKGRASEKVRNMFRSVLKAFNNVLSKIREGVTGDELHNISKKTFEEDGFKTGNIDGRMQGFFHGTGHGLGLALHELPRISQGGAALVAGTVITIEPALYYSDVGGVRLEDAVVVTKNGYRNLNSLPKFLEVS
jgi:Xaa-Pro aminopeptidase